MYTRRHTGKTKMSLKIIRVIYSEYQNLLDTLPCTTFDKYRYVNGNKRTKHCFKRCQKNINI